MALTTQKLGDDFITTIDAIIGGIPLKRVAVAVHFDRGEAQRLCTEQFQRYVQNAQHKLKVN